MRIFIAVVLWFLLLAISWPLAVVVLILLPIIWLILLPFRILGFAFGLVFDFIRALVLFPFRVGSALLK